MAQIFLTESQIRSLFANYSKIPDFSVIINNLKSLDDISLDKDKKYVVKTDTLVSGRFKKGLIKVNVSLEEAKQYIKDNFGKTSSTFIIQPYFEIPKEYYLSIETYHNYDLLRFSDVGGIDIENNWESVQEFKIPIGTEKIPKEIPFTDQIQTIYDFFNENGFAFLEVNPFFIENDNIVAIDFKGRVDNTHKDNYKFENAEEIKESERKIKELDLSTGASLKFKLLNPDAKIWPMIAGGGASIVYFDLIADKYGIENVGFYGEYSGNPTTELTFAYADEVIKNAVNSKAKDKIIIIAGGNANFTDIPKTFDGIIQALEKNLQAIQNQKIKIIVRRAGPNDTIGLKRMKDFLNKNNIPNKVFGIETEMYEIFD